VSILITCAANRNLCDFINLTVFSFLIRISNSSLLFILHVPSLSNVGPYIFLSTLLSKTSRLFFSVTHGPCFTAVCYSRSYDRFIYL
jgi:hypothetical protein